MAWVHRSDAVRTAVLLAAVLAAPRQVAADALPRSAISLPSDARSAEAMVAALRQCTENRVLLVAPALTVDLAQADGVPRAGVVEWATRALSVVPPDHSLLWHLRIRAGGGGAVAEQQESAIEQQVSQVVSDLPLAARSIRGVILEVDPPAGNIALLQYALATYVVQLKAGRSDLEIIVVFPPGFLQEHADVARRVTAYADTIGIADSWRRRSEIEVARASLQKPLLLMAAADATDTATALAASYFEGVLDAGDTPVDTVWAVRSTIEQAAVLCEALTVLSTIIEPGFASTQLAHAPVSLVSPGGDPVVAMAFVDSSSPTVAFLVRTSGTVDRPHRIEISARDLDDSSVQCQDALTGRTLTLGSVLNAGSTLTMSCSSDVPYALLSVRRAATGGRAYETVSVSARANLRVEEIIARWQQYRAAQARILQNYVASCLLSLHFEPTALGSGFDVALQLQEFANQSGERDWVQRSFFVNGVRFESRRGFPLPQLEPEKVVAQPLELALDEKYRYTLLGVETVSGMPAFAIGIEPADDLAPLYSGKIWIDGLSFRRVRMQVQQRGGRSNILSHIETQDYELVTSDSGQQFNLLRAIYVQETLNAAGRSFLLEKTYSFSDYRINDPAFEAQRAEAYASDHRMFRDTPQGLRVLRREGEARVVEPLQASLRSLLMGVFYEGTFDFPIPLAGLSYVDFDFRKTGAQWYVFFAGPIVASNLSRQLGSFKLGVDVALSAIPRQDRVYVDDREVAGERLWILEETVGGIAGWQASPTLSINGFSYLSFNLFRPTTDTDPAFSIPGHGWTVQNGAELRYSRDGYTLTTSALYGTRLGWGEFRQANGVSLPLETTYVRYQGEFSKQFYIGKFTKAALNGGYYGGERLDRFSRYQPSFLSRPRIRGLPGGTDAFDEVGIVGALYGFNVFDAVKVEGLYNRAWARNLADSPEFRAFDGLELDIGLAAPWGTFVQGTISYALNGNIDRYRSRWGLYLLFYKPLGS